MGNFSINEKSTSVSPTSKAFTKMSGDYFDQTPPGEIAEIFAPNIISTKDLLVSKVVYSPDFNTLYFQVYLPTYVSTIFYTERIDGLWTQPLEASFAVDENIQLSSISPDGKKLHLTTNVRNSKIIEVDITSKGFGELKLSPNPINSEASDSAYQELKDGTGYLNSSRVGSTGKDIWCINTLDDGTKKALNVGPVVNSESWDFSPCVAPDGSYMIFGSDRLGRKGLAQLYITFSDKSGEWTKPVNLNTSGAKINSDLANQSSPTLSPDGKYLFFMRHYDMETMDVYWVNTSFIYDIMAIVFS